MQLVRRLTAIGDFLLQWLFYPSLASKRTCDAYKLEDHLCTIAGSSFGRTAFMGAPRHRFLLLVTTHNLSAMSLASVANTLLPLQTQQRLATQAVGVHSPTEDSLGSKLSARGKCYILSDERKRASAGIHGRSHPQSLLAPNIRIKFLVQQVAETKVTRLGLEAGASKFVSATQAYPKRHIPASFIEAVAC